MNQDIKILIKLLKENKENEIANLLTNCESYIEESGQYGSYLFSIISTFIILAPVDKFLILKELIQSKKNILVKLVKYIYPDKAYSPEITEIGLEIIKEDSENKTIKNISDEEVLVFISYSSKDKIIARNIADIFKEWGIKHFLAHENIKISEEWKEEILNNLFSCNVIVPIITENFKNSDYTSQEIGIILGKRNNTLIIPIKESVDPFGFISHIQAGKLSDVNIDKNIIKKLYVRFPNHLFSKLMDYLSKSSTFRDAENRLNFVLECIDKSLDTNKINEILKIALTNGQIYAAHGCVNWIVEQIQKNKDLDKSVVQQYKDNYFFKELL